MSEEISPYKVNKTTALSVGSAAVSIMGAVYFNNKIDALTKRLDKIEQVLTTKLEGIDQVRDLSNAVGDLQKELVSVARLQAAEPMPHRELHNYIPTQRPSRRSALDMAREMAD